jgi:hypothetical protein
VQKIKPQPRGTIKRLLMINAFRQETAKHQLVTEKMKGIITKVTTASNHGS